jgi:hypothetical protein
LFEVATTAPAFSFTNEHLSLTGHDLGPKTHLPASILPVFQQVASQRFSPAQVPRVDSAEQVMPLRQPWRAQQFRQLVYWIYEATKPPRHVSVQYIAEHIVSMMRPAANSKSDRLNYGI